MLSCLPSGCAAKRNTQTVQPQQNQLTPSAVSEHAASLPRPVLSPLPLVQENNWKPKASSVVNGLCLFGLATSIGMFGLGHSQNNDQGEPSSTLNDLTKFSIFLFVVSVCTAGLNVWHIANKRA